MSRIIVGIDPGLPLTMGVLRDGIPVAIYEEETIAVQVQKARRKGLSWQNSAPLLVAALRAVERSYGVPTVVVERVSMRPDQDMSSGQEFVGSMFMTMGVCAGLGWPCNRVAPSVWKPSMQIAVTLKNPKEPARLRALETWPEKADLFKLKKHHNRAEALLLAKYWNDKHGNS